MKKHLFLLLFIWVAGMNIQAQSTLSFSYHHIYGFKDTVNQGSSVTDSIGITNNGPAVFSGAVSFVTEMRDTAGQPFQYVDSIGPVSQSGLAPHSTFYVTCHRSYNTANTVPTGVFRTGINVVVIWPVRLAVLNFTFQDTVRDSVYISSVNGNAPINVNDLFSIYPNPTVSSITIGCADPQTDEPEEVIIFDAQGKICRCFLKQHLLALGNLPVGTYLVEVHFSGGRIGKRKLMIR